MSEIKKNTCALNLSFKIDANLEKDELVVTTIIDGEPVFNYCNLELGEDDDINLEEMVRDAMVKIKEDGRFGS